MNTKQLFWNVHGLNDPDKHHPFCWWLSTNQPLFGALLETRIKEPNLICVMSTICQGWNFTSNHLSDHGGRIVVIWKNPAHIRVLSQSWQTLTYEVKIASTVQFVVTAIYAPNTHDERTKLWWSF